MNETSKGLRRTLQLYEDAMQGLTIEELDKIIKSISNITVEEIKSLYNSNVDSKGSDLSNMQSSIPQEEVET